MAGESVLSPILLHCLGRRPYTPVWQAMRDLTDDQQDSVVAALGRILDEVA